jgi:hypothetical protein
MAVKSLEEKPARSSDAQPDHEEQANENHAAPLVAGDLAVHVPNPTASEVPRPRSGRPGEHHFSLVRPRRPSCWMSARCYYRRSRDPEGVGPGSASPARRSLDGIRTLRSPTKRRCSFAADPRRWCQHPASFDGHEQSLGPPHESDCLVGRGRTVTGKTGFPPLRSLSPKGDLLGASHTMLWGMELAVSQTVPHAGRSSGRRMMAYAMGGRPAGSGLAAAGSRPVWSPKSGLGMVAVKWSPGGVAGFA